jgi:probable phosphoglycerate mutase
MELILIRHGLPERSRETSDPPLAAQGREQARRVAARLAREPIDAVYASTMRRAVQTAEPFAALAGHPLRTHEGVVEYDRNAGSYIPLEELKRENHAAWERFVARGQSHVDLAAFQKTVVETLETIIADHAGRCVAVFCHGGVINVWTAHVLGLRPRLFFEPRYTSLNRFLCARSGARNLVSLNETDHLLGD